MPKRMKTLIMIATVFGMHATSAIAQEGPVYQTYGTHNAPADPPCAVKECIYKRAPGEPSDPEYPPYWTSKWRMYRVFNSFSEFPPPYDGAPPTPLKEGEDYEVSYGATDYDSTWRGPTGEGAMMEHYEKRCLPIFPISNHFTCSFISVGDVAYFVTYDEDRPKGMPPVCLFSSKNHPPRRNFIEHLPYSLADSERLGKRVQGYSFWIETSSGKPVQVGVNPDRTDKGDIMFGYAFESEPKPDLADKLAAPYRHPQSFFFSGAYDPTNPSAVPDAPFVTQNYTDFAMVRPDPARTWDIVKGYEVAKLPTCQLFNPPPGAVDLLVPGEKSGMRSWADIGTKR